VGKRSALRFNRGAVIALASQGSIQAEGLPLVSLVWLPEMTQAGLHLAERFGDPDPDICPAPCRADSRPSTKTATTPLPCLLHDDGGARSPWPVCRRQAHVICLFRFYKALPVCFPDSGGVPAAHLQDSVQVCHGDDLRDRAAEVGQQEPSPRRAYPAAEGDQSAQGRAGHEANVAQVQDKGTRGGLGQAGEFLAGGIAVVLVEVVQAGKANERLVALAADPQGRRRKHASRSLISRGQMADAPMAACNPKQLLGGRVTQTNPWRAGWSSNQSIRRRMRVS